MNLVLKRIAILSTLIVAMLALPSAASAACNVGITNSVTVMPPSHVYGGQTQTQSYQVTACTVTQKVTVQWVRVLDSSRPFMLDPSNRVDVKPEASMGTALSGSTNWTAPTDVVVGHYAIITRYYAQDGNSWPEATAASSFIVSKDVCANIADDQLTVPSGLVLDGGNCVDDVCDNLTGIQTTIPTGMTETNGVCAQTGNPTGDPAKLTITKVANKHKVHAGAKVTFTIRVRNTGKGDAGATRVCDYMPSGLVYVSATNNAFFSRGRICWKINGLKAGRSALIGKVTGQVVKGFQGKRIVNRACIMRSTSASAKPKTCANAPVKVIRDDTSQPSGGVTG